MFKEYSKNIKINYSTVQWSTKLKLLTNRLLKVKWLCII